jgi:hypothetical protein
MGKSNKRKRVESCEEEEEEEEGFSVGASWNSPPSFCSKIFSSK